MSDPTLITPIFPFNSPQRHRLSTSVQNVRESPNRIIDTHRPDRPMSSTGFRPIRSESRDQWSTVSASAPKKRDWMSPA